MGHHRLKAAAGASPADPYFSSTSLLLLGNGTNGGQNNTFVDSSTNNFTITRNGNTTQGSFSPFSAPDGRWSNYFDGGSDRISNASASVMDFGTNNFTVEMWVFLTSTANQMFFEGPSNSGFQLFLESGVIKSGVSGSAPVVTYTLPSGFANAWHHMCVVREGTGSNQTSLYVDGVRQSQGTLSANITTTGFQISRTSSYLVFGYISNFRVVKNSAVYTGASFTVPTAPLTAITNTSLLTCQSNRFKDNSTNAFTITPSGNAAVTSFSPFAPLAEYSAGSNGGSGYFDGSGDYLSLADNAAFDVGSGDWTIEAWIYINTAKNYNGIYGKRQAGASHGLNLGIDSSNNFTIAVSNNSSSWALAGASLGGGYSASTWHHVAVTRSGTTITAWRNGVSTGAQTLSGSIYPATGFPALVGSMNDSSQEFNGFISNFRFVKGTALYSSTFTPPTSPLTAITNTSLLLNFTNASIIDSAAKNDLETVGDAQISTSVKKFGTGSIYFDGTGDTLSVPPSANLSIGTGNFTLEGWIYPTSFASVRALISFANNNVFYFNTSGIPYYGIFGVSDTALGTTAVTTSVWTHVAFVRNGSTLTCYLNGSSVGSTTTSSSIGNSTDASFVGSHRSANYWIGYIDDLRITKGVARYTSNFTPPSAQLPSR